MQLCLYPSELNVTNPQAYRQCGMSASLKFLTLEDLITSKVVRFTLNSPSVPDGGLICIYIRSSTKHIKF